jgi:hypothetical protein
VKNRGDVRDGGVNKTAKLGESRSLSQSEPSPSDVAETTFPSRVPRSTPRTASRLLIRCTRMTCRTSTCHQSTTEMLRCRRIQVEHESMLLHDTMLSNKRSRAWLLWLLRNESQISFGRRAYSHGSGVEDAGCSSLGRMSLLHATDGSSLDLVLLGHDDTCGRSWLKWRILLLQSIQAATLH